LELRGLFRCGGLCPREFQVLFALVDAHKLQLFAPTFLQSQGMATSASRDVERAALFRQFNMRIDKLGKTLTPVRSDIKIMKKCEFL